VAPHVVARLPARGGLRRLVASARRRLRGRGRLRRAVLAGRRFGEGRRRADGRGERRAGADDRPGGRRRRRPLRHRVAHDAAHPEPGERHRERRHPRPRGNIRQRATHGHMVAYGSAMASVLVVEDDANVRTALIRELTVRSHVVRSVGTAMDALREVTQAPPDVVVLDLGLPDLDGAEVLKMLRGISDVPVIIATARDDEPEIVRLLNAGADDYLIKPFSIEHLSARLPAVLRRSARRRSAGADADPITPSSFVHLSARLAAVLRRSGRSGPPAELTVGGLHIAPDRREAALDGKPLELTRREFDLLAYLAARPGRVVARRELLAEVWRQAYGDDQTIDVHLSWLRRKLGETAANPRYLHTVRGVGVRLAEPDPRS